MFDIGSSELLLIVIVAVVVIGPKDLPRVLYKLGQILGKGRAMTRHFRSGIDEMIRQAELEEMEKKWAADNARIMAQNPTANSVDVAAPVLPAPATGTDGAAHASANPPKDDSYSPFIAQSAPQPEDVRPVLGGSAAVDPAPPPRGQMDKDGSAG